jgi:uncharacterized protein YneF (UPF0154 family)
METVIAVAVAAFVGSALGIIGGMYLGARAMVVPLKDALKELEAQQTDAMLEDLLDGKIRQRATTPQR